MGAHQIQIPQPLCRVSEVDDSVISQICAISQTQLGETRELELSPVLETLIRDRGAACQINLL